MANSITQQLPIDGDGICMVCKEKPDEQNQLTCVTCGTPWHATCLVTESVPDTMVSVVQWSCPDCCVISDKPAAVVVEGRGGGDGIVAAVRAIEADESLSEREKAKRRQRLLSGKMVNDENDDEDDEKEDKKDDVLQVLGGTINCSFCMQLPERPVTTPCGHNFCLKCFEKWVNQGKRTCAKCRQAIPQKMVSQPRINSGLVAVIRMARISRSVASGAVSKVYHFVHNIDRPVTAYTTERAKKNGKANAASGKIFVTVPPDHFGPIPPENDPERNQGVLVGECWEDRLECRQWGAHLPHVAGIAGQSDYGAQSVALSGGYLDDEDHGEWFLYTGSGGRDLSGNKRTNKEQSFDQKFDKMNQALRVSCLKGYPVRVVRSHKEKRSSYAPEKGVRYDGVYRIEKCWRKVGIQGFKVCRYLFVRCDNEPAPWTSDDHGDKPRRLPVIAEMKKATDIIERTESPSWDFDEEDGRWKWKKSPPPSKKPVRAGNPEEVTRTKTEIRKAQNFSVREKLLKGFSCLKCQQVMNLPVTTPCGHNFCKSCLEGAFAGKSSVKERSRGGRVLRAQKIVLHCPHCPIDISDFLQDIKVNRELMNVIESLKRTADNEISSQETAEKEIEVIVKDACEDCPEKNDGEDQVIPEKVDESRDEDLHAPEIEDCKKRKRHDSTELTSEDEKEATTKDGSEDLSGKDDKEIAGKVADLDENIDSCIKEPIENLHVPSSKHCRKKKKPDASCSS